MFCMSAPKIHTVHSNSRWVNQVETAHTPTTSHATRAQAIRKGRELARARKMEHVIHRKDGRIVEVNTYGGGIVLRSSDPITEPASQQTVRRLKRAGASGELVDAARRAVKAQS
jgi:hypothetical protein